MQAFAGIPYFFRQQLLHTHMDVFILCRIKADFTGIHGCQDLCQTLVDRIPVLPGDDSLSGQHIAVCQGSPDILSIQPVVKGDRRVEIIDGFISGLGEPSRPELGHGSVSPYSTLEKDSPVSFSRASLFRALTLIGRPNRLMKPAESLWS